MGRIKAFEGRVERVLIWVGAWTTMSGLFAWLVKASKPFTDQGWNWGESIIFGIGLACIVGLVISGGLVAWRRFKPLPASNVEPPSIPADPLGGMLEEWEEMQARVAGLSDAVPRLMARMDMWDPLIDDVRGDVATVNTKATEAHDLSITLQSSGATVVARLDAYRDEVLALRNTADRINERIRAIADRETMAEVRVRITALEEMLFFPDGKGIETVNWAAWKRLENEWRSAIRAWSSVAGQYLKKDLWPIIKDVPTEDLMGEWSFSEKVLPNSDTIIIYKTFCVMRRRFQGLESEAKEAVHSTAFG